MLTQPQRQSIVTEARTFIGTSFVHQGRTKGIGVDCVGLVICTLNNVGLMDYDNRNYSTFAPAGTTRAILNRFCTETDSPDIGDIALFNLFGYEQHMGFITDIGLIHAFQTAGVVSEHNMSDWWQRHVSGIFTFVGEN